MAIKSPAVLLVAFNRPDTTAKVFAAIRAARPARFFFACDGPRPGKPGEAERVEEVRRIAAQVDWPCDFQTRFLTENLGCGRGVSSAIEWFLGEAGEGIILEDDCLPTPAFFPYAAIMLERYRHDERVGVISGTNMAPEVSLPADHGFSRITTCWGWATWRRTWEDYRLIPTMVRSDEPWVGFFGGRSFRVIENSFRRIHAGDTHTWDYQLLVQMLRAGQLTVIPRRNLILNIGFGGGGTHFSGVGRPWWAPDRAEDFHGDWSRETEVTPCERFDLHYKVTSHSAGGKWLRNWLKFKRKLHSLAARFGPPSALVD